MTSTLVVATRSRHKLRELIEMTSIPGLRLVSLDEAGISPSADEDALETFETFEENALAKARYFAVRSGGRVVLADDSGLSVDALGGAPGVRSKRFSGRSDLSGQELDDANNRHLLARLRDLPDPRTAHYTCAIALVDPAGGELLFRGEVHGQIASAPSGAGGFGYDPLFFYPPLSATFGQIAAEEKNRVSHRAVALRAARPALQELASGSRIHGSVTPAVR